jgi:sugar phosphate isomerase/epimerase
MNLSHFGMDTITLAGTLEAKLAAVKRAGFTEIMLSAKDIAGHPDGYDVAIKAVKASGLDVTGFQVLRDYEGLTGDLKGYKLEIAKHMLKMCRDVGSDLLLVCSSTSKHANGEIESLAEDLKRLAMLAVPLNINVAYEALSWGRYINQYPQSWEVVALADAPNLGVGLDSFHIFAHSSDLSDLDYFDPEKIFFVQLSDFMWRETRTPEERIETARHMRVFPGEGAHSQDLLALVRKLDGLGYNGKYSFEVFNDDYQQLPLDVVTARAMHSAKWVMEKALRRYLPIPNA